MRLSTRVRSALTALLLAPTLAVTVATATGAQAATNVPGTTAGWVKLTKAHPVGKGWVAKSATDVPCGALDPAHRTLNCLGAHSIVRGTIAPNALTAIGRARFHYAGTYGDTVLFTDVSVDGKPAKAPYGYFNDLRCSRHAHTCQWQPIEG